MGKVGKVGKLVTTVGKLVTTVGTTTVGAMTVGYPMKAIVVLLFWF